MDIYAEYTKKFVAPEEAVKVVKSGDWVDYSQCCSFPEALDTALAQRKDELRNVNVRHALSVKKCKLLSTIRSKKPSRTIFGTAPVWIEVILIKAVPITSRCSSATAVLITAKSRRP